MFELKQTIQELEKGTTRRLFLRRAYNHLLQGGVVEDVLSDADEDEKSILSILPKHDIEEIKKKRKNKEMFERFKSCMKKYKEQGEASRRWHALESKIPSDLLIKYKYEEELLKKYREYLAKMTECAKNQIRNGLDVNFLHRDDSTPLKLAVKASNIEIVGFLLENKADPQLDSIEIPNYEVASIFLRYGINILSNLHPLIVEETTTEGNLNPVYLLQNIDSDVLKEHGHHLMAFAMKNGLVSLFDLLLKRDVPLTKKVISSLETTKLYYGKSILYYTVPSHTYSGVSVKRFNQLKNHQNGIFLKENNALFFKLCFELKLFESEDLLISQQELNSVLRLANVNTEFMDIIGRTMLHDIIERCFTKTGNNPVLIGTLWTLLVGYLEAGIVPDAQFLKEYNEIQRKSVEDKRLGFLTQLIEIISNMSKENFRIASRIRLWWSKSYEDSSYDLLEKHIFKNFLFKEDSTKEEASALLNTAIAGQDKRLVQLLINYGIKPNDVTGMTSLNSTYSGIGLGLRKGQEIARFLKQKFPSLSFDFVFTKTPTIETIPSWKRLFTLRGKPRNNDGTVYEVAFFCDDLSLCETAASSTDFLHTFETVKPLKLLRVNTWRHQLLKDVTGLSFNQVEKILIDYCKEQELDGWMARVLSDNPNASFEDALYEFVVLESKMHNLKEIKKEAYDYDSEFDDY